MTTSKLGQSNARHARRQTEAHHFTIGQLVRLKDGLTRTPATAVTYRVTGVLPPRGDTPQYRIHNGEERYERVTTQDHLEPVDAIQSS